MELERAAITGCSLRMIMPGMGAHARDRVIITRIENIVVARIRTERRGIDPLRRIEKKSVIGIVTADATVNVIHVIEIVIAIGVSVTAMTVIDVIVNAIETAIVIHVRGGVVHVIMMITKIGRSDVPQAVLDVNVIDRGAGVMSDVGVVVIKNVIAVAETEIETAEIGIMGVGNADQEIVIGTILAPGKILG